MSSSTVHREFQGLSISTSTTASTPSVSSICPPQDRPLLSPSSRRPPSSSNDSSSTFVQTVNIAYEDFAESFLTCSTCLCAYDSLEHNPKLLNCSHTVCQECLQRIVELPQCRNTGSFRCPICRETILVPRGGIPSLPPSFIVNQLMDLMHRQRREVVPKCTSHPSEELLFCETCDLVFCSLCSNPTHQYGSSEGDHTVVPFSIACRRMSEIVLYKANHCVRNLNRASENVLREIELLDASVHGVLAQVDTSFAQLASVLERRREEIVSEVRRVREEKRQILDDQLSIIRAERSRVEQDCRALDCSPEVRTLTRKIDELNRKLDVSSTLVDPRENAFVRYQCENTSEVLSEVHQALLRLGGVEVSRTFPSLCTCLIEPAVVNLECSARVKAVDYHGIPRVSGGDPLEASARREDAEEETEARVRDLQDGSYEILYRPRSPGVWLLDVRIFGRGIKGSPFRVSVSAQNNPVWQCASLGSEDALLQPVRIERAEDGRIIVADSGNDRLAVLTSDGNLMRTIKAEAFGGQSLTGLAFSKEKRMILALNWRSRTLSGWTLEGAKVFLRELKECTQPIDLALDDKRNRLYVLDAKEGGRVFRFELKEQGVEEDGGFDLKSSTAKTIEEVARTTSTGGKTCAGFFDVTCLSCSPQGEVLIGGSFGLHLYSSEGKFLRAIQILPSPQHSGLVRSVSTHSSLSSSSSTSTRSFHPGAGFTGVVGGCAMDEEGFVLASVHGTFGEKEKKSVAQISVSHVKGEFLYAIESLAARMRRPSGLCLREERNVLVADLGNSCVKMFRYK